MALYVYETVLTHNGDTLEVGIPDFGITFRSNRPDSDALLEAAARLAGAVKEHLLQGKEVPIATSSAALQGEHEVVELVVEAECPTSELFTVDEVMDILGVTQPRVSHLMHDGKLDAIKDGRRNLITRESLLAYLSTPRRPGRPRKTPGSDSFVYRAAAAINRVI
jgi:excisionase family DNA binding protein